MKEFVIGKNQCGQRFDKYLQKVLKEAPKSFVYKMLRKKNIKLNGSRAEGKEVLAEGDVVTLFLSDETFAKFAGEKNQVESKARELNLAPYLIYENEHVGFINKPAGMLSQKARQEDVSLVEYWEAYVGVEDGFRPGICNRLDRNTSGLVVGGKTLAGLQEMSSLLRERQVEKYYLAVVEGHVKDSRTLEGYLGKDIKKNMAKIYSMHIEGANYIKTGYQPLEYSEHYTLLQVRLYTGKTHQIRSHLASIGHAIVGDPKYGKKAPQVTHQLLHAWRLVFPELEGVLGELSEKEFQAELPKDFIKNDEIKKLIQKWRTRK